MESYMFTNGLPILFYCNFKELLKIRQLSKAMRKRVGAILKDKKIKVSQDHIDKARKVTKWAYINDYSDDPSPFKNITGGVYVNELTFFAEILEETSEGLQKRIPFNETHSISEITKSFPSLYFDRINSFECNPEIIKVMPKHTFDMIDYLILPVKDSPEIKKAMSKVKRVAKLRIESVFHDLSGVEWLKSLKTLEICETAVTTELELANLVEMSVEDFEDFSNLKCPKLERLTLHTFTYNPEEIAKFTKLKCLEVDSWNFSESENCLPKGLRHIMINRKYDSSELNIEAVLKQCPGLFSFWCLDHQFDIADFQGTNVREIYCSSKTKLGEQSTLRLKKININDSNKSLFDRYPEIISTAIHFEIYCHSFDWKYLPDSPKKLWFHWPLIIGEEKINKYIDKLKGCHIKSITLDKASSARKIMKVAAKIEIIYCNEELEELKAEFKESGCEFEELTEDASKERCIIF